MTLFKTRHVEVAQESRIRKLHTTERGALIFIFGHLNNEHLITQHTSVRYGTLVPEISHSSEIRGLRSTYCYRETLQNLPYFCKKKSHVEFFVFHFVQLYILGT